MISTFCAKTIFNHLCSSVFFSRFFMRSLKKIEGIKFVYFTGADVVRHELVQRIIEAYAETKLK